MICTDGFALRDVEHCDSDGHSAITSFAECHLAATELGLGDVLPVSTVKHRPDAAHARPKGCYWKASNDKGWRLWFNENRESLNADQTERGADVANTSPLNFAGAPLRVPLPPWNAVCRAGTERDVPQPRKGKSTAVLAADKVSDYDKFHGHDALMRAPIKAHRIHGELTMETVRRFNATLAQELQVRPQRSYHSRITLVPPSCHPRTTLVLPGCLLALHSRADRPLHPLAPARSALCTSLLRRMRCRT